MYASLRLGLLFQYSAQSLVLCGSCSASVAVLGKVVVPVLRNDRILSDSAESRAGAAVAVYRRSLLPFVPQRQIPMVLPVQKTTETLQLQSFRWSMPLLCGSCACPLLCTTEVQAMQTVVRTPVEGLVNVGSQGAIGLPTAPAILHVPRPSGVVNRSVTEVFCAVTDQGPRILLDFLCASGGLSQLVPTSNGYKWISRELHAVHIMLVPSLGVDFLGALCTGTGPGRGMPPSINRCTYWRAWTDTFAKSHVRTTTTTTTTRRFHPSVAVL